MAIKKDKKPAVQEAAVKVEEPKVEEPKVEEKAKETPRPKAQSGKKPSRKVSRVANIINVSGYKHLDPYANIGFPPGVRVENVKVSSWMQCQIDAGILKEVD